MAYHTNKFIMVDGNLSDQAWQEVEWSNLTFQGSSEDVKTRAKIRWDDEFLYVGAIFEEPSEWANVTSTPYCNIGSQQPMITNEEFESLARQSKAFALEHSVTISRDFCLARLNASESRVAGPSMFKALSFCETHESEGFRGWQLEVAIPLAQLERHRKPTEGQVWGINLERVQWAVTEGQQLGRKSAIRMFLHSDEYRGFILNLLKLIQTPSAFVVLTLLFQTGSVVSLALMARDLDLFSEQFPRTTRKYIRGYLLGFCGYVCYKAVSDLLDSNEEGKWLRWLELLYCSIQAPCLGWLSWRLQKSGATGPRSTIAAHLRTLLFSPVLKISLVTQACYVLVANLMMLRCKLKYEQSEYVDAAIDALQSSTQTQLIILIAIYVRLALVSEDEPVPLDHQYTKVVQFSPILNDNKPLYNFDSCGICLRDYVLEEHLRQLPCAHHFHRKCIDEWRLVQDKCPLCQHPVDEAFVKLR